MNAQSLSTSSANTPSSSTILYGGWLWLVRIAWLAFVIITLGLFLRGIPPRAENMRNGYQPTIGVNPYWNREGEIAVWQWWDSPAQQAGILDGDILVAIDHAPPKLKPGDSLDGLIPNEAAGIPITLTVRTGNHPTREYKLLYGGENPLALAQLGISNDFMANYAIAIEISFALIYLGIASVIFVRRSNDWLALLASLAFILVLSGEMFARVYDAEPLWRPILGIWVTILLFILFSFLCVFPVGSRIPRWVLALIVAGAIWMVAQWLNPAFQIQKMPSFPGILVPSGWFAIGMVVQFYHYRHATPIQKQQTKWVISGITAMLIGTVGQLVSYGWQIPAGFPTVLFDLVGYPIIQLFKLFLPITIAIAILRYRLWDIDIIINRTLVYGTLTASVIGIYVLVVGVLGTTIQGRANLLISILATGLVAILVQPLRDRLQRGVNRLMYGERDDPITVLSRLGQRLEATLAPDAVLPSLVETVAQTLKLPYVAIELTTDSRSRAQTINGASLISLTYPTIAYGNPQPDVLRLPLIYQSEAIGQLVVAPRAPGEALSPMDRHLLENIAHHAGMAVHAVNLTTDLQRSRQRLVTTREEERRRLRRDLHDGLGPQLAGLALKLETLRNRLNGDPLADSILMDLAKRTQDATADIRHLVYELRPPALDELGLLSALRESAAQFTQQGSNDLNITFEAPASLPPLPAAVEVAVYRITQEALTNVIRHAEAHTCHVRLSLDEAAGLLCLEVQDDGRGMQRTRRAGVGLNSMRERAEELGGRLTVTPVPAGGTLLTARLPYRLNQMSVSRGASVVSEEEL